MPVAEHLQTAKPDTRLGYVVHVKTPGNSGGETRSYQIAQALARAGVEVLLYGAVDTAYPWSPRVRARTLRLPMPRGLLQIIRDLNRDDARVVIERYQFPIFNPGFAAQMLRRRPIVLEVHGFPIDEWEQLAQSQGAHASLALRIASRVPRRAWESVQRAIFGRVAHFIVTSSGTRAILVTLGVPSDRVSVVYNCVDPQLFDPTGRDVSSLRAQLGLPAAGRVVLYAGSLLHEELVTILDAAVLLRASGPQATFVFTGSGPLEQLSALARAKGLSSSQFLTIPPVPHATMPNLLAAADVVLAPYSLRSDRFKRAFHYSPLKIMEALAMEKAVVTVAADELRQTFAGVPNVLFAANGDAASWASTIGHALNVAGTAEMACGRQFILDGYRWDDAASRYIAIIDAVERGQR